MKTEMENKYVIKKGESYLGAYDIYYEQFCCDVMLFKTKDRAEKYIGERADERIIRLDITEVEID